MTMSIISDDGAQHPQPPATVLRSFRTYRYSRPFSLISLKGLAAALPPRSRPLQTPAPTSTLQPHPVEPPHPMEDSLRAWPPRF